MGLFDSVGKAIGDITGMGDPMDFLPGIGDSRAAAAQNAANIAAADKAMQFSERMSSTAYQRGMEDMKKAGLNPMLAFSQGGASTPSGVTPTINSTTKSGLGQAGMAAYTGVTGLQTAKQQADTQQAQADSAIKLNAVTADQTRASTAKAIADTEKIRLDNQKTRKTMGRYDIEESVTKRASGVIENIMKALTSSGKDAERHDELAPVLNRDKSKTIIPIVAPRSKNNWSDQPLFKEKRK